MLLSPVGVAPWLPGSPAPSPKATKKCPWVGIKQWNHLNEILMLYPQIGSMYRRIFLKRGLSTHKIFMT